MSIVGHSHAAVRHSIRFRRVSTRYPLRVNEADDGELERAAADSDEQVATTVAQWEQEQGLEPMDWAAIGAEERDEENFPAGGMKSYDSREHPALAQARKLSKARKGPPTDADRPERPSKPPRVLDGQVDIFGRVYGGDIQAQLDAVGRDERERRRERAGGVRWPDRRPGGWVRLDPASGWARMRRRRNAELGGVGANASARDHDQSLPAVRWCDDEHRRLSLRRLPLRRLVVVNARRRRSRPTHARGWYVFPVAPRGKAPITKRGMLDASTDQGLVAAWWEAPAAGEHRDQLRHVGAARRRPRRRGAPSAPGPTSPPATAATSGRSSPGPGRASTSTSPAKAARAPAGSVRRSTRAAAAATAIAPPSVHGSGAVYQWIDAALDPVPAPEWLTRGARARPSRLARRRAASPPGGGPVHALRALGARGDHRGDGGDRSRANATSTLNALAYRCGRLSAAGQLAEQVARQELVAAAIEAGLDAEEAEATFRSGFTAGLFRPISLERRA